MVVIVNNARHPNPKIDPIEKQECRWTPRVGKEDEKRDGWTHGR